MTEIKVGIIAAPGFPMQLSEKLSADLPSTLNRALEQDITWNFQCVENPLIGSAEDVNKSLDFAKSIQDEHQWDYAIVVTDLPIVEGKKVVVGNLDEPMGTGLVSIPALGFIRVKQKLKQCLLYFAETVYLYHNEQEEGDQTSHSKTTTKFILSPLIISWILLLAGMIRANQPWKEIPNFKKIISLSFATATYLTIFSTPWQLSIEYSNLRFIFMTTLAIGGMVLWIMYAHSLWEYPTTMTTRTYRTVYNITTVFTLLIIIVLSYLILFALLMISVALFVPNDLYNMSTSNEGTRTIAQFLYLTWFVTSLGFLAGALGASVENEQKIRAMTYSYRQRARYEEAKRWEASNYYSSDDTNNQSQSHN
ncbi:hypothetical protein [Staphylococcus simulans]|uniref:hypothetical protein n=1 Tax=Staphylococcus simulans TaxID=1286 RepID=UPI003F7D211C